MSIMSTNENVNADGWPRIAKLLAVLATVTFVNFVLAALVFDGSMVPSLISFLIAAAIFVAHRIGRIVLAEIGLIAYLAVCMLCYLPIYPGRFSFSIGPTESLNITFDPIVGILFALSLVSIIRNMDDSKSVI